MESQSVISSFQICINDSLGNVMQPIVHVWHGYYILIYIFGKEICIDIILTTMVCRYKQNNRTY